MDAAQTQKYREFAKGAWENAVNHKEGEAISDGEFLLSVDGDGYRHTTTAQRIRHIYKQHGNEKTEKARGQIAVTESDIELIPDIMSDYSYIVKNIAYKEKNSAIYAKQDGQSTYIYIEEIGKKRRRASTATFFKLNTRKNADSLLEMLADNSNYNLSTVEVISGVQSGSNPTGTAQTESRRTAANPVNRTPDTPLSGTSEKKSSGSQ
jgi:hypothetical protein